MATKQLPPSAFSFSQRLTASGLLRLLTRTLYTDLPLLSALWNPRWWPPSGPANFLASRDDVALASDSEPGAASCTAKPPDPEASGSAAAARSPSSRLAKKFAGPLGGHHLGFRKADSNGKSVYRVRVSSLSRPDAVSLCEKLKADGGSCFVAKN